MKRCSINYRAEVIPGWTVVPDFQYIWHPGGRVENHVDPGAAVDDATVFGVRTNVSYEGFAVHAASTRAVAAVGRVVMSADLKPILIAGPTASGKSALALALAERFKGLIINADSMQVYRELRVLTARPSPNDEARAPHALYGFVPACEAYSAGRFVGDASAALERARAAGLRPIIVGGTGLYFKALLEGLSPIPAVDDGVRAHWRGEAQRLGAGALHAVLTQRDPTMATRLNPADTQRIVRALEVLQSSGRSLADWQSETGVPLVDAATSVRLVLVADRASLQQRVQTRLDWMLEHGALDEVRALASLGLDASLPAMRAIGVAPLMQLAAGKISRVDALARANAETRQYIKRQLTWLSSNMISWKDVLEQSMEKSLASAITFIQS